MSLSPAIFMTILAASSSISADAVTRQMAGARLVNVMPNSKSRACDLAGDSAFKVAPEMRNPILRFSLAMM
jgi:hypothetical protein